jgi:hypothetical protein
MFFLCYLYLLRIVVSMFWLYIWLTSSSPVFGGVRVSHLFSFLHCLTMYLYVLSFVLWCSLQCPHSNDVWFILNRQLFVGVVMPYLRYLCLLAHSCVLHILSCVFVLFCFFLCTLCCQFLWIVYFKSKHILDCTSGVSPSGGGYK